MLSLLDSDNHTRYAEARAREMRRAAEEIREARLARQAGRVSRSHPVRRHVGGLLIAAGQALAR